MKYINTFMFALSLFTFAALFTGCGDDGGETVVTAGSEEDDDQVIAFNTDNDDNPDAGGSDSRDGSDTGNTSDGGSGSYGDSGNGDTGNGSNNDGNNGSVDCEYDVISLTIQEGVEYDIPVSECGYAIVLRSRGDEATAVFSSPDGEVILQAPFRWEFRYEILGYVLVESVEAYQIVRFRFAALGGSSPSEVVSSKGTQNGEIVINLTAKQPPEMAFLFKRL